MKKGIDLIAKERQRQINNGYDANHDLQHDFGKTKSDMDFLQKAKEAIMKVEHTGNLVVEKMEYTADLNGIRNAKATVLFGKRLKERRDYTMEWDREKEEFANVNPKTDLYMSSKRAYKDFKISQMTERELFDLLRKANRRRKSAERKVRKLRDKVRYINRDAMRAGCTTSPERGASCRTQTLH